MRKTVAALSCLLLVSLTSVLADEKKPTPKPKPSTTEQAADAVLAAVKAKDDAELKALADEDNPDPWLVADLLCYRSKHDAAEKFAKAAPRVDTEKLPAYVTAQREKKSDDAKRRALLSSSIELLRGGKSKEALDALGPPQVSAVTNVVDVRISMVRGVALKMLVKWDASTSAHLLAAEAAERMGWSARAQNAYFRAGRSALLGSSFAAALSAWQRLHAICKRRGDMQGAASTLGNIGSVYYRMGDYAKALSIHEQALAEQRLLGDEGGVAWALGNIGTAHDGLGDYVKALQAYEQAVAEQLALGDKRGAARTLGNIGVVHERLADYAKALSIYEQALAEQTALGDSRGAAATLGNIGNIHQNLGDFTKALQVYERALVEKKAVGDMSSAAKTLGSIGVVHRSLGDFAKALSIYEQARAEQMALGDGRGAAATLGNIGNLHYSLGDYAKAIQAHEQALAEQRLLGDEQGEALTLANIGVVHERHGDRAKALKVYERALVLLEKTRDPTTRVVVLAGLSRIRMAEGDNAGAVALARKAAEIAAGLAKGLGEEQGARARDLYEELFALGVQAAMRAESVADVAFFLEIGRAGSLLESLGGRDRLHATAIPEALRLEEARVLATEGLALRHYEKAVDEGLAEADERYREVEQARAAIVEITARIRREAKAQAQLLYPKAASLDRIQATLVTGDVLVLYSLQEESVALVVGPKTVRTVSLGKAKPIEDACKNVAAGVRRPGDRGLVLEVPLHKQLPYLIKRLRALIIKPLGLPKETKRLLVSPHGALSIIPFELLVGDEVSVTYVTSGTTYELLRDEQAELGRQVLALGDPNYDEKQASEAAGSAWRGSKLQRLFGSGKEAAAVGDVVLSRQKATIGALKEAIAKELRWRAVHLACHGIVDMERPILSALAVTPGPDDRGFLRCLDVYRMKIPADLVVLSACETGKGKVYKAEGIVGLTRAFMFAGAPRVICSLWRVDDEATRALMVKFYELWNPKDGSKGLGAAAALKRAQAFIKGHDKWKHPYYWAAWVLWGLPD